jgi:hypothetical protein
MHCQDLKFQIQRAFDPSPQPAASRATTELADAFDVSTPRDLCWIDYAVVPRKR